ncbi:unnamed protein product, partial [Musa hybrid cultivar]
LPTTFSSRPTRWVIGDLPSSLLSKSFTNSHDSDFKPLDFVRKDLLLLPSTFPSDAT